MARDRLGIDPHDSAVRPASEPGPRRAALELGGLAALAAVFLALFPRRPLAIDVALALVAAGAIVAAGRRSPPLPTRVRAHASRRLLAATGTLVILFGLYGALDAGAARGEWTPVIARLAAPRLAVALALFLPWALVQQILFQRYLLGRWRALLPGAPAAVAVALNGLAFGAVHLPDRDVAGLTTLGGLAWSAVYARDRRLLPIAGSHAALGATYYYWVRGQDLLAPAG